MPRFLTVHQLTFLPSVLSHFLCAYYRSYFSEALFICPDLVNGDGSRGVRVLRFPFGSSGGGM